MVGMEEYRGHSLLMLNNQTSWHKNFLKKTNNKKWNFIASHGQILQKIMKLKSLKIEGKINLYSDCADSRF